MDANAARCPCYFLIPLVFNPERPGEPGKRVPPETLDGFYAAIERQFGGFSVHGEVEGSWHGLREPSIRICVAVAEEEIEKLRAIVREIGRTLNQKEMYFERGLPTVEFIEVEN